MAAPHGHEDNTQAFFLLNQGVGHGRHQSGSAGPHGMPQGDIAAVDVYLFPGDTRFPQFSSQQWQLKRTQDFPGFILEIWEKKQP